MVARKVRKPLPASEAADPFVPGQRTSDVLGLQTEELVVEEHEARDARLFDALDW